MLTAELVRPLLRQRGMELCVNMLESSNTHWQQTANDLLKLFQQHIGHTFYEWETVLEKYEGDRIDYVVIRGLAKVMSGEATFTPRETPLPPPQLRECLFRQGPSFSKPHLFHAKTRLEIMQEVARQLETMADILEETVAKTRNYPNITHSEARTFSVGM